MMNLCAVVSMLGCIYHLSIPCGLTSKGSSLPLTHTLELAMRARSLSRSSISSWYFVSSRGLAELSVIFFSSRLSVAGSDVDLLEVQRDVIGQRNIDKGHPAARPIRVGVEMLVFHADRKSTRLNSSHGYISYA